MHDTLTDALEETARPSLVAAPEQVSDASVERDAADVGFSHIALFVRDIEASIDFYERFGGLFVMHRRTETTGSLVAYLGDGATGFSIVLVQLSRGNLRYRLRRWASRWLAPLHHLGVGCPNREDVDRMCELAKTEGRLRRAPRDLGPPAGYFGILRDPDGNDFELSYQQQMFRRLREHLEAER